MCMEKNLLSALEELKEALESDSRLIKVKEAEALCVSNIEVQRLSKAKDEAKELYSSLKGKRPSNDPELVEAEKKLYQAKLALDNHPLVKDYTSKYIKVRDLYMAIDDILFSPFRGKSLFEESK